MTKPIIGIVGASGTVGAVLARTLAPVMDVRLGTRRPERLVMDIEGQKVHVDAMDSASLERFATGCDIVVNCAGPSTQIADRVAYAARVACAHYVDVAGDDALFAMLPSGGNRSAIVSAGAMPGLSGLLPRTLGLAFDRIDMVEVYVGGRDRFSPAAALDYVTSLEGGYGMPGAAWRNGQVVERMLTIQRDVELPFFTGSVSAFPFLSTEAERLGRALGTEELRWFNVFAGEQTLAALGRLRPGAEIGREQAAETLVRSAALDVAGRTTYQIFVITMTGMRDGKPEERTLLLRASDAYVLTTAMANAAIRAVLADEVPTGRHHAAEVLDPASALDWLGRFEGVQRLEVMDTDLSNRYQSANIEGGVL